MKEFEERIKKSDLPEMAIRLLPMTLTEKLQKRLIREEHMEDIIEAAIIEVNQGSVERLETLILRRLQK